MLNTITPCDAFCFVSLLIWHFSLSLCPLTFPPDLHVSVPLLCWLSSPSLTLSSSLIVLSDFLLFPLERDSEIITLQITSSQLLFLQLPQYLYTNMHTLGKEDFSPLKALKEDWVVKPQNTIQTLPKKQQHSSSTHN